MTVDRATPLMSATVRGVQAGGVFAAGAQKPPPPVRRGFQRPLNGFHYDPIRGWQGFHGTVRIQVLKCLDAPKHLKTHVGAIAFEEVAQVA